MLGDGWQSASIRAAGGGSGEAEGPALLAPGKWQLTCLREPSGGEVGGLATIEDGGGDVGREVSQAEDAAEVGVVMPTALAQVSMRS